MAAPPVRTRVGRALWLRRRAAVAVAVLVAFAALMIPGFDAPGAELDEGLLVAYPARLVHGQLPQGDFYDPYGPGSVWTVAAADELFGANVTTERAVGMVYRLVIVAAAFALALLWGLGSAVLAAAVIAALLVGSVAANASVGFWALALPGYALLARELLRPRDGAWRPLPLAGALLAGSLLMRYDFLPAVVLAALPGVLILSPGERRRFAVGVIAGLLPWLVHLGLVGPHDFWRTVRIALALRQHPARPPFASDLAELVALYALAAVLLLAAGVLLERRARHDPEGRVLLGAGLLGIGLVPFALFHLDVAHVGTASLGVLAMLPAGAIVLARGEVLRRPTLQASRNFALGALLCVFFFAAAGAIRYPIYRQARLLLTGRRDAAYEITANGRSFKLADRQAAHDSQVMVTNLNRIARPGQSVFVGPQDLRTAGDSDVFLYFLLDQLKPASYFMQVDPHTINHLHNGFIPELMRADFLILTTRLTHFPLTDVGPPNANQIVQTRFCVRAASGTYRLYQRCR